MCDMDETEYLELLNAINDLDGRLGGDTAADYELSLAGQLRDERGYRVPGCYSIMPAPVE